MTTQHLRKALERIAAYPLTRNQELSAEAMRDIAKAALAAPQPAEAEPVVASGVFESYPNVYDIALARIEELENICGESYQVVGALASDAGRFEDDAVVKALDNLSQMRLVHEDVLPFPSPPQQPAKGVNISTPPAPETSDDRILDRATSINYFTKQPAEPLPAATEQEGWKLVPVEPTKAMIDKAEALEWGDEDVRGNCINQWHVMLSAAPLPDGQAARATAQPRLTEEEILRPAAKDYVKRNGMPDYWCYEFSEAELLSYSRAIESAVRGDK